MNKHFIVSVGDSYRTLIWIAPHNLHGLIYIIEFDPCSKYGLCQFATDETNS